MSRDLNKFLPLIVVLAATSFLFIFPLSVQAQVNNLMENLIVNTPVLRADLLTIIFKIIQYVLTFLGVVAVVILIYGGFVWMTAHGNEEQVRKAKKIIINGLIGLVVVLLSYAIVSFVIATVSGRGGVGEGGGEGGGGPGGLPKGAKYLVITSKYPKEGETIPKNARIIVTFNQDLDSTSVKLARPNQNSPKTTSCESWTVGIQNGKNQFIDGSLKVVGNSLIFTPKGKCPAPLDQFDCKEGKKGDCFLNFENEGCCGCFEEDNYKITLISRRKFGNQTQIGLKGLRPFGNTMYRDEIWSFKVGPYIDTRAPEVENNLPQGDRVARNVGILVTFTKEVDLSTLKIYNPDCVPGSANCNKDNCNTNDCLNYAVDTLDKATVKIYYIKEGNKIGIPGFFERFSVNSFIFRPKERCGPPDSNLYYCRCLPALTTISVELDNKRIRGANCLALDCTNGKCSWNFKTSDQVDIDPPRVKSTEPENNAKDVDRLLQIKAIFEDVSGIDATSVNEDTFILRPFISPRKIETDSDTPPLTSTFTPSKVLEPDTNYSPLIYGGGQRGRNGCNLDPDYAFGVKDLAGNAMVGNYIWNFKTGWLVNGGDPYIEWVDPKQGPKGECVTVHGYNLGCCAPYECTNDKEAQRKKWDFKQKVCISADNEGQSLMLGETGYIPAEVLLWQEINKPEKCLYDNRYENCSGNTCSADPQKCLDENGDKVCYFCSDTPANCEIKHPGCWCPMPLKYSPKNELIIVVPPGAENQGNDPSKIKVIPAY